METISAIAHKNELTKDDLDDYYLLPQVTDSLLIEDIIERIAVHEIATTSVNRTVFVHLFLEGCDAVAVGAYPCKDGNVQSLTMQSNRNYTTKELCSYEYPAMASVY